MDTVYIHMHIIIIQYYTTHVQFIFTYIASFLIIKVINGFSKKLVINGFFEYINLFSKSGWLTGDKVGYDWISEAFFLVY